MSNKLFLISVLLLWGTLLWGQDSWQEVSKDLAEVEIKSSADGSMQKAMFYKSSKPGQPLVVHLHAWSASYLIPLWVAKEATFRDLNYIYPNFRGPNNRPEACGSDLVISDIADAIEYAIKEADADRSEVHIIGSSGGGHAVLSCYMRLKYPAKSFSAWVSITDLEAWYWEVLARGYDNYADNIMKSTSSVNELDVAEARKRSPLYYPYPAELREGATLGIYTGIHDGYTADVPITQSIYMYNKIVKEKYPDDTDAIVPDRDILEMLSKRCFPKAPKASIGNRQIHYHKQTGETELVVFEGGHEMLDEHVLNLIPISGEVKRNPHTFLALGGANNAADYGWEKQLGMIFPFSTVVSRSVEDNLLSSEALFAVDTTLLSVKENPDYIILDLFDGADLKGYTTKSKELAKSLQTFIAKIKESELYKRCTPKLVVLSCPLLNENVKKNNVQKLNRELEKLAQKEQAVYIDLQTLLTSSARWAKEDLTDGGQLTPKASRIVVEGIAERIEKQK